MELLWSVLIQWAEIVLLVSGVLGAVLSGMLMACPDRVQRLSQRFNRWIHFDETLAVLDTDFSTDRLVYRHHLVFGTVMIIGSLFCLIFLFFRLNPGELEQIFFQGSRLQSLDEVIVQSLVIVFKLAALLGIVLGSLLIFASGKIRDFETRMGARLTTQPVVDRLNRFHGGVDAVFLRYPRLFGAAGFAASVLLAYTGAVFMTR